MKRAGLSKARILVVDDQESNVRLVERLLEAWGYSDVTSTTDSAEVPDLFATTDPDLLLLDLRMPAPDGFELLELLEQLEPSAGDRGFRPVLVLTADITREAKERALALGASDFLTQPFGHIELRLRVAHLLAMRRLTLELNEQNELLEQRVLERTRDLDEARLETLERLALAAEYRDDNTHEHAQRVGRTCALMARALEFPEAEVDLVRRAAPLHDIGKIGIPDSILLKRGRLTDDEMAVMRTHAAIGRGILSGSGSRILQLSETIAIAHHERWDGAGYPNRLAGNEIPVAAHLVAIADVFDALTHERPYKRAWPVGEALAEICGASGTQFDPELVRVFESLDHDALLATVEVQGAPPSPAGSSDAVNGALGAATGGTLDRGDAADMGSELAHELVNVLAVVTTHAQLARFASTDATVRDSLDEIERAGARAVELIHERSRTSAPRRTDSPPA